MSKPAPADPHPATRSNVHLIAGSDHTFDETAPGWGEQYFAPKEIDE